MDAYSLDQIDLYYEGVKRASEFLHFNGFPTPDIRERVIPSERPPKGSYGCGVYLPRLDMILVNAIACAKPSKGFAMQWSFPSYSVDRTPVGVVAHEVGHYIDAAMGYPTRTVEWLVAKAEGAKKVSSYEPNPSEAFAESMRLYITNPALLACIAPRRHAFIEQTLGMRHKQASAGPLAPLRAWGASPAILRAAANKAGVN